MYLATNTRPDIAYPLNQICRCMANPTPDLMRELDRIFVYLYYNQTVGLTYEMQNRPNWPLRATLRGRRGFRPPLG